jgi:hypothetical protein
LRASSATTACSTAPRHLPIAGASTACSP